MLEHYGPDLLAPGEPVGNLRDMRLWMTYLHHRWAIDAAAKYVGGMYHNFVLKGDEGPAPTEIVPAALQREVLTLLLQTIDPANLALPERLLAVLAPPPYGDIEDLGNGYAFDQLRAARILSAGVLEQLLQPDRAARLIAFADRQTNALTFPEVLDAIMQATWNAPADGQPAARSFRRVIQRVALDAMMLLGNHAQVTPEVRAVVLTRLAALGEDLEVAPRCRSRDGRALPAGRAGHRALPRRPGVSRAEERHAVLGWSATIALSAAARAAAWILNSRFRATGFRLQTRRGSFADGSDRLPVFLR